MSARKGFAHIILIAVLAATLAIFGLVYFKSLQKTPYTNPNPAQTPTTTQSAVKKIDDTANWKTYTNDIFSFKYPMDWSTKNKGSGVVLLAPKETNDTKAITVNVINYKLTPPLPVNYTYQTLRSVTSNYGEVLVQIRQPGSEQYLAQISRGDLTVEFKFGTTLDQKYNAVFDQILSTFRFLE